MPEQSWTWANEQRIPSNTAAGREVLTELLAQLERHEWAEHDVFAVHLAVEEALVNAIKHGNREAPDKWVQVVSRVRCDCVRVEITDEGEGFDPLAVPDPTRDENLEIPSGRGLMLMRSFMSCVQYNPRGNQVVLVKRRSDGCPSGFTDGSDEDASSTPGLDESAYDDSKLDDLGP